MTFVCFVYLSEQTGVPGGKLNTLDLIPELKLSKKLHIHMGPIRIVSGVTIF
jgi:hypothetical protein